MNLYIYNRINKFDNYILMLVRNHMRNKYLDVIMPIMTGMGNLGIIWIIIAVSLYLTKPYKIIGNMVIITLIVSTIIGEE